MYGLFGLTLKIKLDHIQAIVWFHLHEYGKALSVLESLYQNIGPIDEV